MEIDIAPSHNPTLFGSLSVSPPTSMFDAFSPLIHLNEDFLDALNGTNNDDDVEDWMKPLLFDQFLEHDLPQNFSFSDIDVKEDIQDNDKEKLNTCSLIIPDKLKLNNSSQFQSITQKNDFIDFFPQQSAEQQLPTSTTTTVRVIHQAKIKPSELPTTLYVSGNELQFHPIVTTTSNGKTIGHTYTTTTSSSIPTVPLQSSLPIVPARVLKGKKFKRGGRVTSRATSRSGAAAKRRLNSTGAEPKASVVIIAEDATRIDSKTTTLGLSSTSASDTDLLKSSSTTSSRSTTRRRVKSTPREVILFRNGAFISKEPITQQQQQSQPTTTLCFETASTTNNTCHATAPLHQQQITATGLQAAAQIVACNVLRQATLNDALIEQLIKREPTNTDDDSPIYCYSSPSLSSPSCTMATAMDEYENSCSTTLKILGCNATAPLTPANTTTTTTTIELLTFAALQQRQQQQQQQFCYIKQEPVTTTTTTTFLLPRLLP